MHPPLIFACICVRFACMVFAMKAAIFKAFLAFAHNTRFACVFGVVLAQGKSPCSEATTDEAVFLLQFFF